MLTGWPARVKWIGEIADLIRREEGEPPAAAHHAGNIVGNIVVRRDRNGISNPNSRDGRLMGQIDCVLALEIRQEIRNGRRLYENRRRGCVVDMREQAFEGDGYLLGLALKIEAGQIVAVEEPAPNRRIAEQSFDGAAAVEFRNVVAERTGRGKTCAHRRPILDQPRRTAGSFRG